MSNGVWVWAGLSWSDRIELAFDQYGDRITDVSMFGWSVGKDGTLTETFDPTQLDDIRARWPHIRFWACFRNMDDPEDGPFDIFEALRDSSTARSRLADQVQTKMFDLYPWLYGVDIDMESGGNDRSAESELVFSAVSDRAHSLGKKVSAALPPLTATGSVGGENWVRYKQLGELLDHVSIMSYDFAWGGSAPGPISPGFWLSQVYDWATSQISADKISMGLPLYGRFWRLHDTPPNLGYEWRGISGTYYSFWQQFNGLVPWYSDGSQHDIGWIMYRDPESKSLWGYLHAYDWLEAGMSEDSSGISFDTYQGRPYAVRYGLPSGTPLWSIANNAPGSAYADYPMLPATVIDVNGDEVGPKRGFTLTVELLRRDPIAATIVDDYATTGQIGEIYSLPDGDGSWKLAEITDTYRQYRGSGRLQYNHDFGSQSLYLQARFHFRTSGVLTIYSQGVRVDMSNTGTVSVIIDGVTVGSTQVSSAGSGDTERTPLQNVLGVRVRENSVRVYFSNAETSVPLSLEVEDVTPPGGPSGYEASGTVWIDHTYLGDGWWYQPREAVEVTVNGETKTMGRLARNDVEWHESQNRFRPASDVDEPETIDPDQYREYSLLDWGYDHWIAAPFELDETANVRVVPLDHEAWWNRLTVFDQDGGFIGYCFDAQSVAYWRSRATHDWNLAGVAMWSMGQEDIRTWEVLSGGELPPETKRLHT